MDAVRTGRFIAELRKQAGYTQKELADRLMVTDKAVRLFERFGVFTEAELKSRAEIQYETYAKAINIEARTMIDMASKQFLPAFIKYTKTLADTVNSVKAAGADASVQLSCLNEVTELMKETKEALDALVKVTDEAAVK